MQVINPALKIYSANMSELTFGQVRKFINFSDEEPINSIAAAYDPESDKFIINENSVSEIYRFCETGLRKSAAEIKAKLPFFKTRVELVYIILAALTEREARDIQFSEEQSTPNCRFVSVDGDIFQVSKIVSVKRRDEAGRYYIEFYITNKGASVKKCFPSKEKRNREFLRIQTILERAV